MMPFTAHGQSKLANLSTRGFVGAGENVMIAGTIITGVGERTLIVRALGPTLQEAGIINALEDPVLEIHDGNGTLIARNDDWQDDQNAYIVENIGFGGMQPRDSAILGFHIQPGAYTAVVSSYAPDCTGIALVEVYDVTDVVQP